MVQTPRWNSFYVIFPPLAMALSKCVGPVNEFQRCLPKTSLVTSLLAVAWPVDVVELMSRDRKSVV